MTTSIRAILPLAAFAGLAFAGAANGALVAGQTLGIDFGDGIWSTLTPASSDPALNGSGSETNFAVLVQQRDAGGTIGRVPGGVNVTGQAISTDITGAALTGTTFTTSGWGGFLGTGDQVGYNAAGVGNYTGTDFSDLSYNDGIFAGPGNVLITISGLDDGLTYDLAIAANMLPATHGGTVLEPVSGETGVYTGPSIHNGGTNPIQPFTLTGLQANGSGDLTLQLNQNGSGATIISALTVTAIPEPSTAALLTLTGLGLMLRRRR